jgi:hypothetical protein
MTRLRFPASAALVVLCLAAAVVGRVPGFEGHGAVRESLATMPAKLRTEWLLKRGLDASRYTEYHRPETTGLRLVGKWGRGPSNEVTGRGNLVALTLGSEVALLSFANPDSPAVLSEIQLSFIPAQTALHDSFLLTGGNGVEVWNISDSTQPVFRNVIPYAVSDFAVFDTFLYFGSSGTFYAYSIADPASPYQLGMCQDSGRVMTATRDVAVAREPNSLALSFIDVSNPAAPHRASTYGICALGVDARGSICVATKWWNGLDDRLWVDVIDISDPANPRLLGEADSVGGYDIHLSGPLAFVSGFYHTYGFAILDISDSTRPTVVSRAMTPNQRFAVWADWTSNWAYVADMVGLAVMDVSNINSPVYDTTVLAAHYAWDVCIDGPRAYVADGAAGLRVLDLTNPSLPAELGGIDSANIGTVTAVARDSFAFAGGWPGPPLRSIEVTDPSHPVMAGGGGAQTDPADMVLRDTLIYLAGRLRFQVVNVARPRQPTLVGSCVTGDLHEAGLWLQGSLAYIAGAYDGLYVVDVGDPQNPAVVKILNGISAWGCCVRESLLFVSDFDDSLHIFSVANLNSVYQLGAVYVSGAGPYDVKVLGDCAFVGASGLGLVDVSDPRNPALLTYYATPDDVRRVVCDSPYVYAACWGGGVLILDTTSTAMTEHSSPAIPAIPVRLLGSVTNRLAVIELSETQGKEVYLQLFDVAGNRLGRADVPAMGHGRIPYQLDLTGEAAGVYIVRVNVGNRAYHLRITKLQ